MNGNNPPATAAFSVDVEPVNALTSRLSDAFRQRIAAVRAAGADIVVASLHWGHEFELGPRAQQRELATQIVDAGGDIVLGHHPHVVQPFEIITSRTYPHRHGVVFYSLGSLTKPLNYPAYALAAVASVEVGDIEGRAVVTRAELIPVLQLVEHGASGQPRASIERLATACQSADPEVAAFATEAARFADHVIGAGWRASP